MLAVVGSNNFFFKVLFLLHVLSAIVAFAPAFVWPIMRVSLRKAGGSLPSDVGARIPANNVLVYGPALLLTGLFGILMVVASDGTWEFSQTWVSIAFVLWFLMFGVLFLGVVPAERKAARPEETAGADDRVNMFGGMLHLLLVLMLIVMVWKPGV